MSLLQEERNIIVQNKYADNFDFAEIEEFINHITHSKGKTFSHFEIERLKTRIVSCERIVNDF